MAVADSGLVALEPAGFDPDPLEAEPGLPAEDQATRVTSERWPVPGTKRLPAADSFLMYSASPLLAAADASIAAASAPIPIHVN